MVHNMLRIYHDDAAHCGAKKTFYGIRANYWFSSMQRRIKRYVENCLVCIMANASNKSEELQIILTPDTYNIHIDHFGPIAEFIKGLKYILMDYRVLLSSSFNYSR